MSVYISQLQVCPSCFTPRRSLLELVRSMYQRHVERTHLSYLDDRLLDDVGISHSEANAEIAKPFWKA